MFEFAKIKILPAKYSRDQYERFYETLAKIFEKGSKLTKIYLDSKHVVYPIGLSEIPVAPSCKLTVVLCYNQSKLTPELRKQLKKEFYKFLEKRNIPPDAINVEIQYCNTTKSIEIYPEIKIVKTNTTDVKGGFK